MITFQILVEIYLLDTPNNFLQKSSNYFLGNASLLDMLRNYSIALFDTF